MKHPTQKEQWQLAEDSSKAYEKYLVPIMFKPWAESLLEFSPPNPGEIILDLACGTGVVAKQAYYSSMPNGEVYGVDINEGMLEVARSSSQGLNLPIKWLNADAKELPFKDNYFDKIFCQQALQFFPDKRNVLEEVLRTLKPGGEAAFSILRSLDLNPAYKVFSDLLRLYIGENAGKMMEAPFAFNRKEEILELFHEVGFQNSKILVAIKGVRFPSIEEFVKFESASSPLAESLANVDSESLKDLLLYLHKDLEDYIDDYGVIFPMEFYMLKASKS